MDDLGGNPLFLETSIYTLYTSAACTVHGFQKKNLENFIRPWCVLWEEQRFPAHLAVLASLSEAFGSFLKPGPRAVGCEGLQPLGNLSFFFVKKKPGGNQKIYRKDGGTTQTCS